MSSIYFTVSKIHLIDNYMKENLDKDYELNVKNVEISDESGEKILGWQIYPSTKSSGESFERISGKLDFNVVRDSNILLGLIIYGENVCFFNSVIQVLYCLLLFRDYINKL